MSIIQQAEVKTVIGQNFSAVHTGPFSSLNEVRVEIPALGRKVNGKLFLRELLGATGMQVSLNNLLPGVSVPFTHRHKENEEVYIFIRGQGQIQIDERVVDVKEGTVVRISTDGSRCLRNNSLEELHYVCIQAKADSLNQDTFEDGIPQSGPVMWPQ
jgi:mannose-6-phosphate isomerase-like protein (cupin superfamily)